MPINAANTPTKHRNSVREFILIATPLSEFTFIDVSLIRTYVLSTRFDSYKEKHLCEAKLEMKYGASRHLYLYRFMNNRFHTYLRQIEIE